MRYDVDPAPELTEDGHCSDCRVQAIWAGGRAFQICPKCYALLWHIDHTAKERQDKEAAAIQARERAADRKAQIKAERANIDALARAAAKDHKL